jgi:hypothetical protein
MSEVSVMQQQQPVSAAHSRQVVEGVLFPALLLFKLLQRKSSPKSRPQS